MEKQRTPLQPSLLCQSPAQVLHWTRTMNFHYFRSCIKKEAEEKRRAALGPQRKGTDLNMTPSVHCSRHCLVCVFPSPHAKGAVLPCARLHRGSGTASPGQLPPMPRTSFLCFLCISPSSPRTSPAPT
ncbi:uncharacterized protein WM294_014105 isoform 1-T1 [Sarcoramphus papa]